MSYPLIQLFAKHGGHSGAIDKFGFTPWDYAVASGWKTELDKSYRGIKYYDYELFQSLRSRDSKPVLEHLADGKNPDVIERCETLVHVAANNGDCPALSALIKRKQMLILD